MNEEALYAEIAALRGELERARAETAAREAELVASAKLVSLGSLLAGIAHELNSPLGALYSNHDVLKRALGKLQVILEDEVVDETELDELRRVVRALDGVLEVNDLAVHRMVGLVKSLRSFGRPDRSERSVIDINEAIDSTLALLEHQLRDRVEVIRDYEALPGIECYANQLNQVFMNLLVNASQAIRERGRIMVRTRSEAEGVLIEIEDNGVGISADTLQRIFEPGFTRKEGRIGMGLGLLIVRQIVDRHHGAIDVRSTPGVGTVFTVRIAPLTRSEQI